MTIKQRIVDGKGHGYEAQVTDYNALVVTTVPASAAILAALSSQQTDSSISGKDTTIARYFNSRVTHNGDGVTIDMLVNGSVTPQEFWIAADTISDIIITQIVIILADGTVATAKFGALAALANGWDLKVIQNGEETFIIEKAKTGGQILVQSGMNEAFGSGGDVNEVTAFEGNDDALIITIPMDRYIPGGGLRLPAGSTDRIVAVANDNLTSLTQMRVRCIGHRWFI